MKWELDHANSEERVFNDYIGIFLSSFRPEIFAKADDISAPEQLLSRKFLDEAASHFIYE